MGLLAGSPRPHLPPTCKWLGDRGSSIMDWELEGSLRLLGAMEPSVKPLRHVDSPKNSRYSY